MVTKGSILVVDDEVNLCRIIGAKLAKSGYDVTSVHDGLQAVEKVRESQYDVVLLDLILPKMDGLTALEKIRGMRCSLPVIVMTACENAEAMEQARNHGVFAYVNKPFDLDSLVNLVHCTSQSRGADRPDCRMPESTVLFARGQQVTVEVHDAGKTRTYPSRISSKNDVSLSVESPKQCGKSLAVPPRTAVRVGLAAGDAYYSFTTNVLSSSSGEEPVLVLDKPRVIYRAQRRTSPRTMVELPINYARVSEDETELEFGVGRTKDLSLGGACLVIPEEIMPGEMLHVEIRPKTDSDKISLIAEVLRAKLNNEREHIIGCRFTTAQDKLKKLLKD
ncbi:MAG: response regulator [Armatimonadetes bacterium]|jgi:CheY-like chemotaxis protein|nr:response regulator [Armatimonadota bacterium]